MAEAAPEQLADTQISSQAADTSAKRRKGYALFSAAFALPAFEKNAVAFLKLF